MPLLKFIAVPTAITAAACGIFAATSPVRAQSMCMPFAGGQICANAGYSSDRVTATIAGLGVETMDIKCANGGYSFSSHGQWSQSEVETFVEGYCEGRGWYAHN